METRTEVKTIKIEYKCPKCESGCLEYIDVLSILHMHQCNNKSCQHTERLPNLKYPRFEYEKDERLYLGRWGYIVVGTGNDKVIWYGYPHGGGTTWQVIETYPLAKEQQDKVKHEAIFLKDEIEIRDIEGKETAFIKSLL